MRTLLTDWNIMRIIRLVLGVIVIGQGVHNREGLYYVLGGLLTLLALANAGCCGTGGCVVATHKPAATEEKEIVNEEVDRTN